MIAPPVKRLLGYALGLVAAFAVVEVGAKHFQPLLVAARHRALFKAALLRRKPPMDVLFFGTSRTGEGLRPSIVAPLMHAAVFNLSVQYSSFEILEDLTQTFSHRPGLKQVLLEISASQLGHHPLAWRQPPASLPIDPDFDSRVFAWLSAHSALVAEREAFVLEGLSRTFAVLLFAPFFDGSEQFGIDYFLALRGHPVPQTNPADAAYFVPVVHQPAPSAPLASAEYEDDAQRYARMARDFASAGVKVAFFVPPSSSESAHWEAQPAFQEVVERVSSLCQAPVIDFAASPIPNRFFRDPTHLNHQGGTLVSRVIAEVLEARPAL